MKKKAATKEPFLPFFVGDFLAATAEWDGEERALYMLLLSYQWALGSLPTDARKLRKVVDYQESTFERWWPTVSTKFELRAGRLLNARLEVHRAKTKELSAKNSASGRKGAAARWEGTGENMADARESDGERHGSGMATATNKSGERHKSAIPKRHPDTDGATDGNPSHPIPSHPIPSDGDTSVPHSKVSVCIPEDAHAEFERVIAVYPEFIGAPDLLVVEKECRRRIDEGATWAELLAAAQRFAAFVKAGGRSGPAFVLTPLKFFSTSKWRDPWTPPPTKDEARVAGNIDETEQWLRERRGTHAT